MRFTVKCIMKTVPPGGPERKTGLNVPQTGWRLWIVVIHYTLCIIHLSHAQPPTREQLVGTWIGIRAEYDEEFYRPNPVYIALGTDSTYSFGLIDANSPVQRSTWSMNNQTVRLDTNTYALSQWTLSQNELRLTAAYPMAFRRLTELPMDSATVSQALSDYSWITDSVSYDFHADGSACLKKMKTVDVAVHCWRLAQVGRSVFIVIKGNQTDCNGNLQYPLQIMRMSASEIYCQGGGPRADDRLLLRRGGRLRAGARCEPKGFQPCRTYIFPPLNLYPYFAYRQGRLFDIRQVVEREFKPLSLPGQSGLIRFRFVVNCRGEAGRFELLEVDESYKKCSFDPRIINQLSDICQRKLSGWEPGKPNGETEPVDTVCLLTFRLKDGLITEIFP